MKKCVLFIIMGMFLLFNRAFSNTWQDMTSGYPLMDSYGYLALCDGGTGVIYAGSWATGGVYRTVDNGATWSAVSNVINFECLLTDPNTPSTLWGSNWDSGFITDISTDALNPAITWQNRQTGLPLTAVHSISIVGSNSNQLLCSGNSGTFRTTNAGLNWTMVDPSNPASGINMMETKQSPWNADEYYICGSAGVAVYSWNTDSLTTLSPGGLVMWMSFDCAVPGNYYFIKLDGTVYYYNNTTGVTSFLSQISGETAATRIENVCCCGSPVIYAAGRNTGVHISTDNGNTWQAYNNGMALVTSVYSFVIDCVEGYIWAGSGTEGPENGIWRNDICPFTPTCTLTVTTSLTITTPPTATTTATLPVLPAMSPTITPTKTPYPEGMIQVYPDPASISNGGYVKFINLPSDADVLIYTLSGEIVSFHSPLAPVFAWQCRNVYGKVVSPGIYYYVVRWDYNKKIRTGKIFLIQ